LPLPPEGGGIIRSKIFALSGKNQGSLKLQIIQIISLHGKIFKLVSSLFML
jgi:hypothetical protein